MACPVTAEPTLESPMEAKGIVFRWIVRSEVGRRIQQLDATTLAAFEVVKGIAPTKHQLLCVAHLGWRIGRGTNPALQIGSDLHPVCVSYRWGVGIGWFTE